jgi:hypothetical protein
VDHVTVGQDEPVWRENDAGPATLLALHSYDGRAYGLDGMDDGGRVGVEQIVIGGLANGTGSHAPILWT